MGICWGSPPNDPTPTGTATPGTSGSELPPYSNGQILPASNMRIFTFAELKAATNNFSVDAQLGEGGFGKVFRGRLESAETVVAVKKLNSEILRGLEAVADLGPWSEIHFLGCLSHPNLVKLLGYCFEETELLLVYECMQKGSLENHLFGRGSAVQPLPWDMRLKIAIGAARGLSFLHTTEKVIYRDFKASNILLDGSYNAKISDIGLAKLGPSAGQSHVTTGHLYVKSDVYGFGVVLVEILTAQRALDTSHSSGQHNLTEWIQPYLRDNRKLKNIMDSRLEGKYPAKAAYCIAQLASKCLAPEPKQRPSMNEVLESLEQIQAANEKTVNPKSRSTHHTPRLRSIILHFIHSYIGWTHETNV